jgi:hypothetical protein
MQSQGDLFSGTFILRSRFFRDKDERMGRASRDAGGLETLIYSVHAQIALDDLAGLLIQLRDIPRAGGDTFHAAVAEILLNIHDTVFVADAHSSRGTGRDTQWFITMPAWSEPMALLEPLSLLHQAFG